MEEIQKVNDIYREELAHINYDFVTTLDAIRDSCKNQGVLDNVRSKTLQRSAYRDMTFKNLAYQYQGPVQVQGMQNVSNIPNPVPAGPPLPVQASFYPVDINSLSRQHSLSQVYVTHRKEELDDKKDVKKQKH
ncbi:hypothetical protein BOH78_1304 [Pichia kudriavzevii]|uniref:Uncharacterized protein n=1 Tax=Pichia kudriavzevii TaxID=4909 RepID=A0A1V2LRG6_PICKU|nr:hypothetical protein BOH78_1304 [Pichia kudriavzevii]